MARSKLTLVGVLLMLAAPATTHAADLTIGLAAEPSMDPHVLYLDTNVAFSRHIYGALTQIDTQSRPQPDLASSWRLLDNQMLTRAGVLTKVDTMLMAVYFGTISRPAGSGFSVGMMGLGLGGFGEAVSLNLSLHTPDPANARGGYNFGRVSDPAVDLMIEHAMTTMDTTTRGERMAAAMRKAMETHPVIPLYDQMVMSATRKGLAYETSLNEHTLAMRVHPAK